MTTWSKKYYSSLSLSLSPVPAAVGDVWREENILGHTREGSLSSLQQTFLLVLTQVQLNTRQRTVLRLCYDLLIKLTIYSFNIQGIGFYSYTMLMKYFPRSVKCIQDLYVVYINLVKAYNSRGYMQNFVLVIANTLYKIVRF